MTKQQKKALIIAAGALAALRFGAPRTWNATLGSLSPSLRAAGPMGGAPQAGPLDGALGHGQAIAPVAIPADAVPVDRGTMGEASLALPSGAPKSEPGRARQSNVTPEVASGEIIRRRIEMGLPPVAVLPPAEPGGLRTGAIAGPARAHRFDPEQVPQPSRSDRRRFAAEEFARRSGGGARVPAGQRQFRASF